MLTREYLAEIRHKALRKRIWYRTLDDVERDIFSLSVMICDKIQSNLLHNQLVNIIMKLKNAQKGSFINYLEHFGRARVISIQNQAKAFGSKIGSDLILDHDFLTYLVFLDYNQPKGWGMSSS